MTRISLVSAAVLAGWLPGLFWAKGPVLAGELIVNPHVRTDRSVDTRTAQTMAAGLVKPGMTEQQKAIAIYNYVRRVMFHYRHLTQAGGGGATNLINGVGYCLCTPTAGLQVELCQAAGLNAKILTTPGHGSVVVFWDGKWHWMDAFLGGCVYAADGKTIASLEQVLEEPSLLKREKASPVSLLPCRDLLLADALRFEPANTKYHGDCGPDDFAWTGRAKPGAMNDSYWRSTMTLDITLRPGERYVREWDNQPGMFFLTRVEERFAPPHHFCGIEAEQRDVANWPFFKPYVREFTSTDPKTNKPMTVKTGRYWANGTLAWQPDFSDADLLGRFARAENVKLDGRAFVPADPSKPAVLEWRVACPYMLQGGQASLDAAGSAGVSASIAVDANRGDKSPDNPPPAKFQPLPLVEADGRRVGQLRPALLAEMGTRGYTLRFELAENARLAGLAVTTVFQHNMFALPQLMPGANEVTVELANPESLGKARFFVELAWEQDGRLRTDRRRVDRSPMAFRIDTPAGGDLVRMRRLSLSNGE